MPITTIHTPPLPPVPGLSTTSLLVELPGARLHVAEQGAGPLVLLVHGFPETWWSWRHQLPALAAAGFRAVAVDLPGHGLSTAPAYPDGYRATALVQHLADLVAALGERNAVLVGHDVGSPLVSTAALLRPDVVRAVGLLGVPYAPRGGPRPSEAFAALGADPEFYVSWFQQPGRAEADIEADVRRWLSGLVTGLSGGAHTSPGPDGLFFVPAGARMSDRFPTGPLPGWLTAAELEVTVQAFTRTGFAPALARYRSLDRDWADLAALDGAPVRQPSLFIGGTTDSTTTWMADVIAALPGTMTGLRGSHLVAGAGHWVHQERADAVNALLVDWLRGLPAG